MKTKTTTTLLIAMMAGLTLVPGVTAAEWVCEDENGVPYPSSADNDNDGSPDCRDADDDNDTLSDRLEEAIATNSKSEDSDGDGIPDAADLDPLNSASILLVRVNMAHIQALDRCGDGDAWDPYFSAGVLDVIGKSFKFTGMWGASEHLEDLEGPVPADKLPRAFAGVPSDFRAWELSMFPMPWSTAHVGLYDYDFFNADDQVHLNGASADIAQSPLSLVTGRIGHASSGGVHCSATVSLSIHKGLNALQNRIGELHIVKEYDLIDCKDVGLGPTCERGGSGNIGALAEPPVPAATPSILEDLFRQTVTPGHVAIQVFAPDTAGIPLWEVRTAVNGAAPGPWKTLPAGHGYAAAMPPAGDLQVELEVRPATGAGVPLHLVLAIPATEIPAQVVVVGIGLTAPNLSELGAVMATKEAR